MPRKTFHKEEKLKSRKTISRIFSEGKSLSGQPLKLLWVQGNRPGIPLEAAFAVPKRTQRRAVDRNQVKRWMREAYRLNRETIQNSLTERNQSLSIMFLFQSHELHDYFTIEKAVKKLLAQLNDKIKAGDIPLV